MEKDFDKLESRVRQIEIDLGIQKNNIQTLKNQLNKIDNNIGKLLWIGITAIALAVLDSILKGGVHF